jgi:hypothetical protein
VVDAQASGHYSLFMVCQCRLKAGELPVLLCVARWPRKVVRRNYRLGHFGLISGFVDLRFETSRSLCRVAGVELMLYSWSTRGAAVQK